LPCRQRAGALIGIAALAAALAAPSASAANKASTPGVSAHAITIGLITSLTGVASSEYNDVVPAAMARIDLQNAHGGVDGRKIKLITEDDQSTPDDNAAAAQALVSKGVFGVIDESPFVFGGTKVLQQAGVPVTGSGTTGPEWGEQPNTNMFSTAPVDPHYPANTAIVKFFKRLGAAKIASFGFGISPSATASAKGVAAAAGHIGLTSCYLVTSVPFGAVSFTDFALAMKHKGCTALYTTLDTQANLALVQAAKRVGVAVKVAVSADGYGQTLLDTAAANDAGQGTYFQTVGVPVEDHTKGTKAFQGALAKYAHFTGVPNVGQYEGWTGAALMIKGLEMAGKDPTRPAFIAKLRKVTRYTAGGVIPSVNLTSFGKDPRNECVYFVKLSGSHFVPVPTNGRPVCGTTIPGSTQIP
jgi:branched-chain amino acid transport system substrate-binding protein